MADLPKMWGKMSTTLKKRWWAAHGGGKPFPAEEGGRSAAAAKRSPVKKGVKTSELSRGEKTSSGKMSDVRRENIRRMKAAMERGTASAPQKTSGAGGSGMYSPSSMKDIRAAIKSGAGVRTGLAGHSDYDKVLPDEKKKKMKEEFEQVDEMDKSQPAAGRDSDTPFPKPKIKLTDQQRASAKRMTGQLLKYAKMKPDAAAVMAAERKNARISAKDKATLGKVADLMRAQKKMKEEIEQVDEIAKWRTNPKAHDLDTDGSYLSKTHDKIDPLQARNEYLSSAKDYIRKNIKNVKNARKQSQGFAKSSIKMFPQKEEVEQDNKPKIKEGITMDRINSILEAAKRKKNSSPKVFSAMDALRRRERYMDALRTGRMSPEQVAAAEGSKYRKEEVEQMDEVNARHSFVAAQAALTPKASDVKAAAGKTARDKALTNKYARRISKLTGGEYSKQDVKDNLKSLAKEEVEQMDEMKSSNPKGLAYKITAASHAANPSYGPHDPSVDPKTNFGAGATRASAVAGLRVAREIKSRGGNPNDPEHIETISKAVHGSPDDYDGEARGWSQHALTSTNQTPEQKARRSKLTGKYSGLSNDEQEKDRQIARVIANRVHQIKEYKSKNEEVEQMNKDRSTTDPTTGKPMKPKTKGGNDFLGSAKPYKPQKPSRDLLGSAFRGLGRAAEQGMNLGVKKEEVEQVDENTPVQIQKATHENPLVTVHRREKDGRMMMIGHMNLDTAKNIYRGGLTFIRAQDVHDAGVDNLVHSADGTHAVALSRHHAGEVREEVEQTKGNKKEKGSYKPVNPKDLVVPLSSVPDKKKPRGYKQYDPRRDFPGVFEEEIDEAKFETRAQWRTRTPEVIYKNNKKIYDKMKSKDPEKAERFRLKFLVPKTEEVEYIEEKLTADDPASTWIRDFVNSDNPKFKGKSKEQRKQMALGAYYAAKRSNEEVVQEKLDPVGGEDKDIDNDGDHDKTDRYLHARRQKIGAAIAKKKGM